MTKSNEKLFEKLRDEYFHLVKLGFDIQERGDIKAYTVNAIRAENIAQKMQAISRRN
ncbi:MAG: DUF6435 family protein [Cytophagales bacterium]|nr:DUF6435 family protein [Cytophagales bacterium]